MCNFFSFVTEPENYGGQRFYFGNRSVEDEFADSHSHICHEFGLREDLCNKYEYNPFTKNFHIDQINSVTDDRVQAEEWVRSLNFDKLIKDFEKQNKKHIKKQIGSFKVGDVLEFKPLSVLKKMRKEAKIPCGWNSEGYMDYLVNEHKTIVVTQEIIDEALSHSNSIFMLLPNTANNCRVQNWSISKEMLRKVKVKQK